MDKIKWCLKKRSGLSLIEPNSNLAESYIEKAEGSLKSMRLDATKDWKISIAYYAMYFSLYSVLMRVGVKCEIHSCTLEFAKHFLGKFFSRDELDFLKDSMEARIDAQYYVNRTVPSSQYKKMMDYAPQFFVKCKSVLLQLNEKKINEVRAGLRVRIDF